MNAPYEPSIASEVLRLCNRDTVPAPAPEADDAPQSSIKELARTSEPSLDTIPAPPPSSADDEEEAPPTVPSPPRITTIEA